MEMMKADDKPWNNLIYSVSRSIHLITNFIFRMRSIAITVFWLNLLPKAKQLIFGRGEGVVEENHHVKKPHIYIVKKIANLSKHTWSELATCLYIYILLTFYFLIGGTWLSIWWFNVFWVYLWKWSMGVSDWPLFTCLVY